MSGEAVYTRRTRRVTAYEFACLAAEWKREGADVSALVTYDDDGCIQRHVFAPTDGIHAIYTISDTAQLSLQPRDHVPWRWYAVYYA